MAVVHVAAGLPDMSDEEQVTPAIQLLNECLVEVAVQRPVAKVARYACRGILYPADGLMHRGGGEQPQHHTDSRHGGFRLAVGLVSRPGIRPLPAVQLPR